MPTGSAPAVPPGGEAAGLHRLKQWAARGLAEYADQRDEVGLDATSRISPYLHFGCLSPLEVATRLHGREGGKEFVRQLCWRDFFHQFLAAHPETAHRDVRDRAPRWSDDSDALTAWRDGRTGFPLVDAGMRQLLREGWMHNRARMVVASFLTKDLMIDWRAGAAHFMEHLVDGDIAVNQLNWQWVAGTGTDTNPHRVYNPTVQSRKFDRAGSYIRRYVAELTELDGDIHDPAPEERAASGYPDPIIDHKLAIERWRAARSGA
jgi:deoxyribodipyrimidine photo-lyase